MKRFVARVSYQSDEHGSLDVDYAVDDLEEAVLLIENGPGMECVSFFHLERPPHMPVNETIESLARKLLHMQSENGGI